MDTLKSCKISKFSGGGGAQGDDKVSAISCEFTILEPIRWNGTYAKNDSDGALSGGGVTESISGI